ncbi:MAG: class I SAM-dependent methyltransferase [Chloroflexi bacterium]|nr:MAG: class I SAM-dependent methyltransferase [Chloroflexota bacterium]
MADPGRAAARAEFSFAERVAACDVCGAAAFSSVDAEANVVSCDACGYRFVNPRPSQSEIAAAYSDPHFYDGWIADDTGRHEMWRKRLALVRQHTQRPGPDLRPDSRQGSRAGLAHGTRLLDVGAGIGAFLAMAREQGWTVAGTEVSTSARNLARERYGLDLLFGQAEDLPLPSQAFDVVTLWHVLEHVPSPARLLRACAQALVPGGFLVVAVPNEDDAAFFPNRVKRSILGAFGRHPAPRVRYERLRPGSEIHLSHFTLPVLRRLLTTTGFDVRWVSIDDHYTMPNVKTNVQVALYRTVRRVTGANMGQAMVLVAELHDGS